MLKQLLKLDRYNLFIMVFLGFVSDDLIAQNKKNETNKTKSSTSNGLGNIAIIEPKDTVITKTGSKPSLRWQDRFLNSFVAKTPQSPFYLKDPKQQPQVLVSPIDKQVSITEKASDKLEFRYPQSLSFQEYNSIQNNKVRQSLIRDLENLQDGKSAISGRGLRPLIEKNGVVDRIFGGSIPDLKPNGFVTLDFKVLNQFRNDPATLLIYRRRTTFDFNEQININFNGKIGDKLGILTNLDTKAAFNFENQLKLNFKNQPEDILQKLEAGNISMPVRSQLIPGVQNLMGVKAAMRFGKLDVTAVVAQQRSRTESIVLNGGLQNRTFEIRCDNYEENKHFFLGQFFRDNYEKSLKNLPLVTSGVRITRLEVYVTNRTNSYESMRNLAAFADIGDVKDRTSGKYIKPIDNKANDLYGRLYQNETFRKVDESTNALNNLGLRKGSDYEILRGAKRLTEREYKFHPELGYISLVAPLRNDEILAVAYEYTYQGQTYKVGELTEDYASRREDEVIMLKLIKSSTIRNKIKISDPENPGKTIVNPMWNLMMKNIYSLGVPGVGKQGFQLRIIYKDDKTGIDNPNLQEGKKLQNIPLIRVMNLDRLNPNNDPQLPNGDGNFDFVEDLTIDTKMGKMIFPVLEPFGTHLEGKFDLDEQALKDKYVFNELYSSTLADAQQITTKNKFFIRGSLQASNSSEIMLPLGASGQSVRIFAGGVQLREGADYLIEPQLGKIKITNQSILNSARQIRIEWEKPDLFNTQRRIMLGTRLDYNLSKDIHIGATAMSLSESTPGFLTRVAIGQEPVNNKILGLDLNLRKDSRFLTKMLDALPLLQTKELSSIQLTAEYAKLLPAVNNNRINGSAMIDDFEAVRNINDLTRQPTKWRPAATPEVFRGNSNNYDYNFKRAKISVYTIDQSTYFDGGFGGNVALPPNVVSEASNNLYERAFTPNQIFPGKTLAAYNSAMPQNILDVAYFPAERGMYNYTTNLDRNGYLSNPKQNFGAVVRGLTADNDFDNANTEYLTFWMLDPFADIVRDGSPNGNKKNTKGGKLKFHLGDISEDFIPDGRNNFENGLLPTGKFSTPIEGKWGKSPSIQFLTDAFDNQDGSREKQDVGLDGLSNSEERIYKEIPTYLQNIKSKLDPEVYKKFEKDPSGDDFKFFIDEEYDKEGKNLLERFKNYLGLENNSPVITAQSNNVATPSNSVMPDKEDVNADNTINDVENFYEYDIDLQPGLDVNKGFIVDKVTVQGTNATWYLFRVPVKQFTRKVGDIDGFKSIRFMRMVLTDFEEPVVLRFAALQLESNSYRTYDKNVADIKLPVLNKDTKFKMGVVNIEENSSTKDGKTAYVVPPGFIRDQDVTQQQFDIKFNEQSLSLSVADLHGGDSRAIFKNTRVDMLNYKNIRLFIHAENETDDASKVGGAFVRIGTDLSENYYEIEIPQLKITPNGSINENVIWPEENSIDVALRELVNLKASRGKAGKDGTKLFSTLSEDKKYKLSVLGNPDLSSVQTMMLGLRNTDSLDKSSLKTYTVWMDELRAYGFDQTSGDAALLSANIKLADFANLAINANYKGFGFGGVQDKISERSRENGLGIGIASNVEVDKLFPEKWGLRIPLFFNYDQQTIKPHFNPLDPDMPLDLALSYRPSLERLVVDHTTRKGFNFSNVRKNKTKEGELHFYNIENFSFTYAQNKINKSNILIDDYHLYQNKGGITYQFQPKQFVFEPFKKSKNLDKPMLYWLKDFNFSPIPTMIAFRTDFDKNFSKTVLRSSDLTANGVIPIFEKYFIMNRFYDVQWNFTKSILFNYNASMNAIIDEPQGDIDSPSKKDSLWRNIKSLGRAKNFTQDMRFTYRLPLDKFFLLDWMTADAKYNNNFSYQAVALNMTDEFNIAFGNTIKNGRDYGVRGKVDFVRLYNKVKFLRFANTPTPPKKRFTRNPGDDEEVELPQSNVTKNITRLLMTVRGIDYDYSIVEATILPGFMPSSRFFGLDPRSFNAPGFGFVMGKQDEEFQLKAAENGWLSQTTVQTQPFTQTRQKKFSYRTTLEPSKSLRIQISGNLSRGDSYQEYFTANADGSFSSKSPVRNGNYGMSFWGFRTAFQRMNTDSGSNYSYVVFENMLKYRDKIQQEANRVQGTDAYDKNAQDILIPAFFAAYSGKSDRARYGFNPFNPNNSKLNLPLPNWRIDYSGLASLEPFNKVFSSISISHSYTSNFNVGNFTSSSQYNDLNRAINIRLSQQGYPLPDANLLNSLGKYAPVFVMSTVTIDEKFAPFIGVQFVTKKGVSGKFEYNKERRASLNLSNSQIAEATNDDFVFSFGFKKNNVRLPLRGRDGKIITLKNDLNFTFNFMIRDSKALLRRLDGDPQPTQGVYNLQFGPRIAYQVNKRVMLNFYFNHSTNNPFVSSANAYLMKINEGGINVRFSLSDI